MKQNNTAFIKKGFSRYPIRTDILISQKRATSEQAWMFAFLSSVVFLIGFSFTLIGKTAVQQMAIQSVLRPTALERDIQSLVDGYPIEGMSREIARQDPVVAAFLVAIAKKESNWGRRVPVLDGKDCYNYWGFREVRDRMGTGGHTCFDNKKDAVRSVAKRIETLIYTYHRDTPREMIVWKCGNSCEGHSPESVDKWVSDVDYYYRKLRIHQVAQTL